MSRLIRSSALVACAAIFYFLPGIGAAAPPPADPLGRANPRSAVTQFLETVGRGDYQKAAGYLDLHEVAAANRARQGPNLARELGTILNSDSQFDVLRLSQAPEGNLADDPNPNIEHIASIQRYGQTFSLELERVQQAAGQPEIWLFTPATVAAIPRLTPLSAAPGMPPHVPRFLISVQFLNTPLWKWLALFALAILMLIVFRFIVRLLAFLARRLQKHLRHPTRWVWIRLLIEPVLLFLFAIAFGIFDHVIAPSALARLYIGRTVLLAIVAAFAWFFSNVFDLLLTRADHMLEPKQRLAVRSMLYLARRAGKIAIVGIAIVVVINNWGYQLTAIITGMGIGGIAIALAAQSTIANIFGGVSVVGDSPVMIGDYGNFGGLVGTVEDIGMRSTRIRTLARTIVSVPNSHFATINLENYSARDKILFNPTLQIKRTTPKDQLRRGVEALEAMLRKNPSVEAGSLPVRISALSAASFALEIFAYVLTADNDEYYKIQGELFLAIDDVLTQSGVELA